MTTTAPHTPRPRPLTRSTQDKKIAGVSGGLGAYFKVDPVLFRIAFVVGTVFGGAGLLAYVALLFVPTDADVDATAAAPVTPPPVVA
jgi:phage shock protein PspC (stress-responsive transcriptional regulator)